MYFTNGNYIMGGNFKIKKAAPMDDRGTVAKKIDLQNPNLFDGFTYNGMIVSVVDDTINNGLYRLEDKSTLTWKKEGSDVDLTNYYTKSENDNLLNTKVDKEAGKSLVKDTKVSDYDRHLVNIANPHNVTALQVGAYSKSENDNLLIKKANLDINNKIPLSEIPDSILGQLKYMGVWNFGSGLPTGAQKGNYWITSVSGNGYEVGDWAVYNGTSFDKVDNTDAVSSVAGRTGNVVLNKNDVGLNNVDNTSDLNKPISTATQTALDTTVKLIGNETIAGIKTFSSNIVGNITGNSGTATKLATARTIGGVSFDGTANINLPGVNAAGNQNTTGNAGSATKLATARTINGVAFDGSANITVSDDTKLTKTNPSIIGSVTEQVYNLTGTVINPANGTIQYKTVSSNTTFTETLISGQSVLLRLINANKYTITFPTITWVGAVNPVPVLTANCAIALWKEQSTLYGAYIGTLV